MGIERIWSAGDVVEVKYAMKLRSEPAGENRVAYSFGPWLLGAPASENLAYFNEMTTENKLVRGKEEARAAFGAHLASILSADCGDGLPLRCSRVSRPGGNGGTARHRRAGRPADHVVGVALPDGGA